MRPGCQRDSTVWRLHQDKGLIAIDSSSGSDSSSSSSNEDDDSSDDHFSNALPGPVYSETVPEGSSYFVHKKSKIMHRARSAASVTFARLNSMTISKRQKERSFSSIQSACGALFTTTIV